MSPTTASGRSENIEQKVENSNVDTGIAIPESTTTLTDENSSANQDVIIYVQLRPRWAAKDKAMASLENLAAKHSGVEFSVAGVNKDARHLNITLAVNAGPITQVAKNANNGNAVAQEAFAFVTALFTQMFEFLPQYTTEPTAEQRTAATVLMHPAQGTPAPKTVSPAPRTAVELDATATNPIYAGSEMASAR